MREINAETDSVRFMAFSFTLDDVRDALLTRAGVRYPLHAIEVCVWQLERLAGGQATLEQTAAFVEIFLADLRQLRAGTFGAY